MKNLLLILILTACCHPAGAQVIIALLFGDKLNTDKLEFGLTVSPCFNNITNIEGKAKNSINLGLYFNIKINENFFIHPEAIAKCSYGAKGIPIYATGSDSLDALFEGGAIQRNIKAVGLLVLAHYRISGLLFAEAGPQFDLMTKSKDVFKAKAANGDITYTTVISDQVTKMDAGIAAGLVYKLKKDKGMGIGIRYFAGLTDIIKPLEGTQANSSWLFHLTIPIGTGKAPPSTNTTTSSK